MSEVPFVGGNLSNAVRAGDTVRRTAGPWTPAVHALLRHLEATGFDGAPRVLGMDERGREILSYVEGDAPTGWPDPYPAWIWSSETLESAAGLLRRYHDTAADFIPPEGAEWRSPSAPGAVEVIGHGDVGPFNTVFQRGRAVAMLDWDHAAPCSRIWDIAVAVWRWIAITDTPSGEVHESQGRRIRRFCQAYGWPDVAAVVDLLPARIRHGFAYVRARAAAGEPGFVKIWSWDQCDHMLRNAAHAATAREELLRG